MEPDFICWMRNVLSMPSVLNEAWLGRRVVVRRSVGHQEQSAEGRPTYSDALGDLIAIDATDAVIDTRAGVVKIPRSEIALARLVKPSPAAQLALEATAARGWRAATLETNADGWLLRADGGWTGRANSALPLRTLNRPLDETLAEVTRWYADRGQLPMIQVPLPTHTALDRALDQRGWTYPEDVHVLVARVDLMLQTLAGREPPAGLTAETRSAPDEQWLRSYHYRGSDLPPNAAPLLTRHERVTFLTVRSADDGTGTSEAATGDVLGIARGVVDDGWLGITALEVSPAARRRGVASFVMGALARWGSERGAAHTYLQVSADNVGGLALYDRLGFYEHHSYRYRVPPTI
ncbi:MAG: GCN5-like N-acetyltransferase [Pseudonocardiales bacterium]|nr:GCN5-like N-acetyltransferase [Pseudonocardiales bacterium]